MKDYEDGIRLERWRWIHPDYGTVIRIGSRRIPTMLIGIIYETSSL